MQFRPSASDFSKNVAVFQLFLCFQRRQLHRTLSKLKYFLPFGLHGIVSMAVIPRFAGLCQYRRISRTVLITRNDREGLVTCTVSSLFFVPTQISSLGFVHYQALRFLIQPGVIGIHGTVVKANDVNIVGVHQQWYALIEICTVCIHLNSSYY